MYTIFEDYNGATDTLKFNGVDKFVKVYPKPNLNTPLGSTWKFEPCFLPIKIKNYMEQIENFKVRPDDVWSVTFAKSGSTWSQEMIWLLNNDLNYELGKEKSALQRFLFLEYDIYVKDRHTNIIEISMNMPSSRLMKSHLPAGLLPKEIWTVKPKIIYTARGTKDLAVSYFHHYVNMWGSKGTMKEFFHAFLNDKIVLGPYHDHFKSFWFMRLEENVLFITYEEMKADLMAVIKKTSSFLGKSYTDDQLGVAGKVIFSMLNY